MTKNLLLLLLVTLALLLLTIYVINVGAQPLNEPLPLTKDSAIRLALSSARSWGEPNPQVVGAALSPHGIWVSSIKARDAIPQFEGTADVWTIHLKGHFQPNRGPATGARVPCEGMYVSLDSLTGIVLAAGCEASSPSASSTSVASMTPTAGPAGFPSDIYPPPMPVAPGINISTMTTGCPNPEGVEQASDLPADTVNEVFQSLASGDLDLMRRVADRAYWPYLPDMGMGIGTPHPFSQDRLDTPRAASESPYAGLLENACGSKTLQRSWWVRYCPGPCADPNVARSESLTGNYFLIQRRGHWLVWAAE